MKEFNLGMGNSGNMNSNEMFEKLFGGGSMADSPAHENKEKSERICANYNKTSKQFQPGEWIVWKDGLKSAKVPNYNQPILVVEVFDPIRANDIHSGQYHAAPFDMRCLANFSDGLAIIHPYDSRCFELYTGIL